MFNSEIIFKKIIFRQQHSNFCRPDIFNSRQNVTVYKWTKECYWHPDYFPHLCCRYHILAIILSNSHQVLLAHSGNLKLNLLNSSMGVNFSHFTMPRDISSSVLLSTLGYGLHYFHRVISTTRLRDWTHFH